MMLNVDLSVLTVHKIDYGKQSVIQDDSDDHVGSYYGNYNYGATVFDGESSTNDDEDVSHSNEDDDDTLSSTIDKLTV